MQIVFQNPYNSLNPRISIGKAIMEPMIIHQIEKSDRKRKERVSSLLERVGLDPNWFNRYPHELSGGQRQRVCIARALALNPQFIICDESVSALDVSVQAQVLNLFKDLQQEFQLTYIFISHDLSVVRFMSDRIMVMNKGELAEEINSAQAIITQPQSAYTQKLINSIPQFPDDMQWLNEQN
jgi:peptide/nickel transport system ATP-binding protein